jgi:hypothetical protein
MSYVEREEHQVCPGVSVGLGQESTLGGLPDRQLQLAQLNCRNELVTLTLIGEGTRSQAPVGLASAGSLITF